MLRNDIKNVLIGLVSLGTALTADYFFSKYAPARFFPSCTYALTIGFESVVLFAVVNYLLNRVFEDHVEEIKTKDLLGSFQDSRAAISYAPPSGSGDSAILHPPGPSRDY